MDTIRKTRNKAIQASRRHNGAVTFTLQMMRENASWRDVGRRCLIRCKELLLICTSVKVAEKSIANQWLRSEDQYILCIWSSHLPLTDKLVKYQFTTANVVVPFYSSSLDRDSQVWGRGLCRAHALLSSMLCGCTSCSWDHHHYNSRKR